MEGKNKYLYCCLSGAHLLKCWKKTKSSYFFPNAMLRRQREKKLFNRISRAAPKTMYRLGFRGPRNIYAFAIPLATKLVIFINRGSSYLYGATV